MGYLLQHRLGRGGMGVVDLALDSSGRPVALKRLAITGSAEELERARARLRREVETLRHVRHDAIVPLLDVLDDGDDLVLVMPYLSGGSLADRVLADGPLAAPEVIAIADRLLPALAAMHRRGVVHRDCKPANVLFDEGGDAYLTDFGVAALRDATGGLTDAGAIVGTPAFIAPEQARGEEPTTAADVFALGATLYFAATGHPVYGDTDGRTMLRRAAVDAIRVDLARLDPRLARLLGPMLQPSPRRRPTAARLAGGPEGTDPAAPKVSSGPTAPVPASSPAPPPRAERPSRRWLRVRPSSAAVAFGVIVTFAAGVILARTTRLVVPTPAAADLPGAIGPTTTCAPQPYRPCGKKPAANTDGERCLTSFVDLDEDPGNGCEAAPDRADGVPLDSTVTANLVPRDDTDSYPFHVTDNFSLTCNGALTVTLVAPKGVAMVLEVAEGSTTIERATSRDGAPAVVRISEPRCGTDDTSDLVARVRYEAASARTAGAYTLTRTGNF